MKLNEVFKKYGINLRDENDNLRNVVDVLEDMYLKMNLIEYNDMMTEIARSEEEEFIFDNERGRKY
jgi:hypothetical protein